MGAGSKTIIDPAPKVIAIKAAGKNGLTGCARFLLLSFRISKEHIGVVVKEQRILHPGITGIH